MTWLPALYQVTFIYIISLGYDICEITLFIAVLLKLWPDIIWKLIENIYYEVLSQIKKNQSLESVA